MQDPYYRLPKFDTKILFCSHLGGAEITRFISYEDNAVTLQFLNDKSSFSFKVNANEVFVDWESVSSNHPSVIAFNDKKRDPTLKKVRKLFEETSANLQKIKAIRELNNENLSESANELINQELHNLIIIANSLITKKELYNKSMSIEKNEDMRYKVMTQNDVNELF